MKWILLVLLGLGNFASIAQSSNNLNRYLKTGNVLVIGQVVQIMPDIIQDDLGTAYGALTAKCCYSIDLNTLLKINCPIDTLQSLIYLSTNENKTFIEFKKQEYCLLFLVSLKLVENQSIPIFQLIDEEALFRLTHETIQQINIIQPLFKQLNLYDFIH